MSVSVQETANYRREDPYLGEGTQYLRIIMQRHDEKEYLEDCERILRESHELGWPFPESEAYEVLATCLKVEDCHEPARVVADSLVLSGYQLYNAAQKGSPPSLRERAERQAESGGDRLPRRARVPSEFTGGVVLAGEYLMHYGCGLREGGRNYYRKNGEDEWERM